MYQKALGRLLWGYGLVRQERCTGASGEHRRPQHPTVAASKQQHLPLVYSPEAREPAVVRTYHVQCLRTDLWG